MFSAKRGFLVVSLFDIVVKKNQSSMQNIWEAKKYHKSVKKGNPAMFPLLLSP